MIKRIILFLENWCLKRGKQFIISDRNKEGHTSGHPYLVRSIVFQSKLVSLYIHRFLISDLETLHDHPWPFFTYVVSGSYKETMLIPKYTIHKETTIFKDKPKVTYRKEKSLAFRWPKDVHRVEVDKTRTLLEINEAPLTVCLIGPRIREWGFWVGSSIKRWVDHKTFLGTHGEKEHYEVRRA